MTQFQSPIRSFAQNLSQLVERYDEDIYIIISSINSVFYICIYICVDHPAQRTSLLIHPRWNNQMERLLRIVVTSFIVQYRWKYIFPFLIPFLHSLPLSCLQVIPSSYLPIQTPTIIATTTTITTSPIPTTPFGFLCLRVWRASTISAGAVTVISTLPR